MNNEQLTIIQKVIDRIAPKYTFGFYEVEDVKQEAFIICAEALERYDEKRPLENFISKHLSNRLKTLKRDKYFRNNHTTTLNDAKKMLMDLGKSLKDSLHPYYIEDMEEKLSTQEALELVMEKLSPSMRNDFLRIANGVSIQSHKKTSLFEKIREILGENW